MRGTMTMNTIESFFLHAMHFFCFTKLDLRETVCTPLLIYEQRVAAGPDLN